MSVLPGASAQSVREEARFLLDQARRVGETANAVQRRVERMTSEGPALNHVQAALLESKKQAIRLSGELQDLARMLLSHAADLDQCVADAEKKSASSPPDPKR